MLRIAQELGCDGTHYCLEVSDLERGVFRRQLGYFVSFAIDLRADDR